MDARQNSTSKLHIILCTYRNFLKFCFFLAKKKYNEKSLTILINTRKDIQPSSAWKICPESSQLSEVSLVDKTRSDEREEKFSNSFHVKTYRTIV